MNGRFAFTAQFWGPGAVVCRAVEDRPGPIVEQQFGEFATWTQAHAFATSLNAGLELDAIEVRQIVTSSLLATACVVREALNSSGSWADSIVGLAARAAQLRFVLAELALALTLCRSASLLSGAHVQCMLLHARKVLLHSTNFLEFFDGDDREWDGIASRTQALGAALQHLSFLDSAA
jgi:hypothetical protein